MTQSTSALNQGTVHLARACSLHLSVNFHYYTLHIFYITFLLNLQAFLRLSYQDCISLDRRYFMFYFYSLKSFAIIRIAQSALYSIPWHTCSIKHGLGFSVKHPATLQLMREDYSYRNIQPSEVEQCRVKNVLKILHGGT